MKAVTGNRLADGRVVYLAPDDLWTECLTAAAQFAADEAADVLAAAQSRVTEVADAYLIDVEAGAAAGREKLRETIRSIGPTVRPDLAREAEAGR
jgi:hypothetical protein